MSIQSPFSFSDILEFISVIIILIVVTRLVFYLQKIIRLQKKCKLVWTPIDFVERRSNLSYDDFIQEYASLGKPVIITDVMKNLKIFTKWNFDFFKLECGSIKVKVKEDNTYTHSLMTVSDYINYMSKRESNQRIYIANWYISDYPELLKDYEAPIYFSDWSKGLPNKLLQKYELGNPDLFIGHQDTSIGLHKDQYDASAWIGMIYGRKRIILFTPDQEEFLYDGKVNVFNPDLEKFPLYAKTKPVEVVLEAGEAIYIPSGWWHHVKNLEDIIAVGSLLVNECNSELVFQSALDSSPVIGYLLPLVLEFPWLGRALFALGLI